MIRTTRLLLRQWRDEDRAPFAAMNADPVVRAFWPSTQDRTASDCSAERMRAHITRHGFGFWAAELADEAAFVGFVGICHAPDHLPFAPAVEIGWRLALPFWGRGLATEGALAALEFGFATLRLPEVVSFAVAGNHRSRAVMKRIGMRRAGQFEHPDLPPDSPLREHVLYRIAAPPSGDLPHRTTIAASSPRRNG